MAGAIALSLAVLAFLGLWGWLIATSRRRTVKVAGGLAWLAVLGACVAFAGLLAVTRLENCLDPADNGWRVFQFGTDDVCDQRSLFDVLF